MTAGSPPSTGARCRRCSTGTSAAGSSPACWRVRAST
jgi:hypothetical protein